MSEAKTATSRGRHRVTPASDNTFTSAIFPVDTLDLAGRRESFVRGGRHLFPLLPKALGDIVTIGVIGWGSQGPAQAQNLRESLAGTPIRVVVGLREGSGSFEAARRAGFTEAGGALGEMFDVIAGSDLVLLLISDAAQAAFSHACESITGPIARTISRGGLKGVYESLSAEERAEFDRAYSAAYEVTRPLMVEIYDEVESGNELRSVILAGERLKRYPITPIEGSRMWQVGAGVRTERARRAAETHAFTAGIFLGTMMAQVDLLTERGHPYSEIANESVIEAVDSLLPYMHARGVAYMVDNCSTTARLGSRKWAPRFDYVITEQAYVHLDEKQDLDLK